MSAPLCLSLYGSTDEICAAIEHHPDAPFFEIRLDLSSALDLQRIRVTAPKPLIFASHSRPELLASAGPFADYLDVGSQPPRDSRSIVSIHTASGDPDILWSTLSGNHITKIVIETEDYSCIRKLLALNSRFRGRALCFAMGEAGSFSRILSVYEGAPWMYASLEGRPTAPGQFTYQELVKLYRLPRFTSRPALFGILGDPVSHSRSPAYHNERFAAERLPWLYVPLLCRDLDGLFEFARDFGMIGFSVTHPHKQAVLKLLDEVSEEARVLNSCNTIALANGRWIGTNTDITGAREMLKDVPLQDARMVILGAGSSARVVASVARTHVRELHILSKTPAKAQELAAEFGASAGTLEDLKHIRCDVLFQTTPVGIRAGECPVNPQWIRPGTFVLDILYHPPETELLRAARALGCKARNGESWFNAQAEAQFLWWKKVLP